MQKVTLGILAHVDSGKTTLSEGLLYTSGALRKLGRVDHGDAFLDTDALERERGITIFSKQAMLFAGDKEFTLLDTPGHVDFSAEMERTLSVLDYAVLVISGSDGVQSHTRTLWRLLTRYEVPTFLFINKMDLAGADKDALLRLLTVLPVAVSAGFSRAHLAVGHMGQPGQQPAAIALHAQALVELLFRQRAGNHDQPVCFIPVACHAQAPLRAHGPGIDACGVAVLMHATRDAVKGNGHQFALETIRSLAGDGVGRITHVVQVVVPRSELISQMP